MITFTTSIAEIATTAQPETQRPITWMGGALDPSTRLLKQFVQPGQAYFRWTEQRALARWLDTHRQQPALLIAHSYGASSAAAVIAAGHPVAELVTLDPVGWHKPDGAAIRRYCPLWRNYQAVDPRLNFANFVAMAGGRWRRWPATFAHQHLNIAADHAAVVATVLHSWRLTAALD